MKKQFSIRTAIGLCAIVGVALAMPAWARGKSGGGHNGGGTSTGCTVTYVTTTVADIGGQSYPFQIQSDDFNGTPATYTTETDSSGPAYSEIMKGCNWILNLTNQTTRTIKLTLNDPDPDLTPYYGNNNFLTTATAFAGGFSTSCSFGTMTSGQTQTCSGADIVFWDDYAGVSSQYHILMKSGLTNTSLVQVTCNAGSPCTNWTVTPAPGHTNSFGQPAAIGELGVYAPAPHHKIAWTVLGYYYVSFHITVTNP